MIALYLSLLVIVTSCHAVSEQPRQVFLEGILNGSDPIVPVISTISQSSIGTQPNVVPPISQSPLLPSTLVFSSVSGVTGSIPTPGVPHVVPASTGTVQVGTTLMVLSGNGSVFHFINQTESSITPLNG